MESDTDLKPAIQAVSGEESHNCHNFFQQHLLFQPFIIYIYTLNTETPGFLQAYIKLEKRFDRTAAGQAKLAWLPRVVV